MAESSRREKDLPMAEEFEYVRGIDPNGRSVNVPKSLFGGNLDVASEEVLGGVKASTRSETDTNEVKIDPNTGKLYCPPSEVAMATAEQIGGIVADAKTEAYKVEAKIDPSTGKLYVPEGEGTPPDDEDITIATVNESKVLQFKDKAYDSVSYSGLGRAYLRKNITSGINLMTQEMFVNEVGDEKYNTRYIIQYDYDLKGNTITVPSGCILDFQGGSINNGYINLNSCKIESSTKCFTDIVFVGDKWLYDFNLKWIGTSSNGDSYGVLKDMVSIFNGVITKVYFDENIKSEGSEIILPLNFHIDGRGNTISFTSVDGDYCFMLGNGCSLKDLTLSVKDTYAGCVLLADTQLRPLNRACNQFALNNVVISAPWNDSNVYYHTGIKIRCTNETINDGWNYLTGCYIDGLRINNCKTGIDYETINYNDDTSNRFAWSNSFSFTRLYVRGNLGLILNFYDNGVNNPEDGASGLHNFSYYEFQALNKDSLAFITNAMPTFSALNVWDCTINGVMNIGAKVYIGSMLAGNKGSYSNTYYEDETGRYRIINGFKCYSAHLVFGSWHNDGFRFKLLMPDSSTPYTTYGKTKDKVVSTFTGNNAYSKQLFANRDSSFISDIVYCDREIAPVKLDFHSYNEYESYLYKPNGFGRIINRNLARIPITDDFICTILPNNNVLYIVRIKNEDGSKFVANSIYEVSFKFLIPYKGKYGTDAESFKTYGEILNIDYSYGDDNYFYIRNYHDTIFGDNIEILSIVDKSKTTGLITFRFKTKQEISYVNFMQIIQISSDVLINNVNDDTIKRNKRFDNYATKISDLSISNLGKFFGTSTERPSNMEDCFIYFDTDLNKPIWWVTNKWVDANGDTV